MNHIHATATAVEKLNRLAKARRNATGEMLAIALEQVAVEAGYSNWKHVKDCAARTQCDPVDLLPAMHRHRLYMANERGSIYINIVNSVDELSRLLGGIEPVLIRHPCDVWTGHGPCFCQLDPFATAMRAGVALDVGDKYDHHNYLFDVNGTSSEYEEQFVRHKLGLGAEDAYPRNQDFRRDIERSNSLNPNSQAYAASTDNRSNQLNPNNWRFRR